MDTYTSKIESNLKPDRQNWHVHMQNCEQSQTRSAKLTRTQAKLRAISSLISKIDTSTSEIESKLSQINSNVSKMKGNLNPDRQDWHVHKQNWEQSQAMYTGKIESNIKPNWHKRKQEQARSALEGGKLSLGGKLSPRCEFPIISEARLIIIRNPPPRLEKLEQSSLGGGNLASHSSSSSSRLVVTK